MIKLYEDIIFNINVIFQDPHKKFSIASFSQKSTVNLIRSSFKNKMNLREKKNRFPKTEKNKIFLLSNETNIFFPVALFVL